MQHLHDPQERKSKRPKRSSVQQVFPGIDAAYRATRRPGAKRAADTLPGAARPSKTRVAQPPPENHAASSADSPGQLPTPITPVDGKKAPNMPITPVDDKAAPNTDTKPLFPKGHKVLHVAQLAVKTGRPEFLLKLGSKPTTGRTVLRAFKVQAGTKFSTTCSEPHAQGAQKSRMHQTKGYTVPPFSSGGRGWYCVGCRLGITSAAVRGLVRAAAGADGGQLRFLAPAPRQGGGRGGAG